jgi:nucleoside-diphosphate-sugar epimerase
MPRHHELDLFDPAAVGDAVGGADAVLHLATKIAPLDQVDNAEAWRENDRLRTEAARILVDAALAAGVRAYLQPTLAFVYPRGEPATEDTPVGDVPVAARSALVAEAETERFAASGGRGVVLRLGLLDGPHTGNDEPLRFLGASLHVADAARAFLAALELTSGTYNVCRDDELVSNARFKAAAGWSPEY